MTKQLSKGVDFSKFPCDILISTPFRLQYAIKKRKLDLSKVEILVLDESDTLFELGLVEQVDAVVLYILFLGIQLLVVFHIETISKTGKEMFIMLLRKEMFYA